MNKKLAILALLATGMVVGASAQGYKEYKWDGNIPIPDSPEGPVFASIFVDDHAPIVDLDVDLIIQHTWQGDLKVWVVHVPSGISADLIDRPGVPQGTFGFSADNFGNPQTREKFFLDDAAPMTYDLPQVPSPGINNVTGRWKPDLGPLSRFNGIDKFGEWRLFAQDFAGGDTGAILNFSLHILNVPEPATLLAIGSGLALLAARRRRKK